MLMVIKRGDIFYADLRPVVGPTIICAAITSKMNKAKLPTHVPIDCHRCELEKDSVILLEQIRTIDKSRLREKVCHLNCTFLKQVDHALKISLSLDT